MDVFKLFDTYISISTGHSAREREGERERERERKRERERECVSE